MNIVEVMEQHIKMDQYENFLYVEIEAHREHHYNTRSRYSKGYYETLEFMTGTFGLGTNRSKQDRLDYVNMIYNSERTDAYAQGQKEAIQVLKKHREVENKNIYGDVKQDFSFARKRIR